MIQPVLPFMRKARIYSFVILRYFFDSTRCMILLHPDEPHGQCFALSSPGTNKSETGSLDGSFVS